MSIDQGNPGKTPKPLIYYFMIGSGGALLLWLGTNNYMRIRALYAQFDFDAARFPGYQPAVSLWPLVVLHIVYVFCLFALIYLAVDYANWSFWRREPGEPGLAKPALLLGINLLFIFGFFLSLEASFKPLTSGHNSIFTYHPYLLWQFVPGATKTALDPWGNPQILQEINAQGCRGPEISRKKPANTKRIFILGDSALFAVQVYSKNSPGALMQEILDVTFPENSYEVLNASLARISSLGGLYLLEHRIIPLQPDIVFAGFNNDGETGLEESLKPPHFSLLVENLVLHSSFCRVYFEVYSAERRAYSFTPSQVAVYDKNTCRVSLANYVKCLSRMAQLSRTHGFKLVFLSLPEYVTGKNLKGFVHLPPSFRKALLAEARLHNYDCIDFKTRWGNKDKNLFMPDNYHLTPEGSLRLSAELVDYLIRKNYLP